MYEDATLFPGYTVVTVVDRTGLVMMETRIQTRLLTEDMRRRYWRWFRANVSAHPLRVVG